MKPFALSLAYPGGQADIWLARLNERPRNISTAREALARILVAERAGCAEHEIAIARDPRGAPYLEAPTRKLEVSLAARDDVVAAAVADGPVGVDVETLGDPFEPPLNVLHPSERAALVVAGDRAHEAFLRIWTAKEAYVKALGVGLTREPSDIEIRPMGGPDFTDAKDFRIFDRGRPVPTELARGGVVPVGRDPVMLACIILPP